MRVAESLELPDQLIRANNAGELVVFAGAGVSMGAPSCLPGFEQLARQIAGGKVAWEEGYAKRLDEYLGRAAAAGVHVETRAREFLRRPGGHTTLHTDLLRLFTTPERVRLITTNFDTHFTSAAKVAFPQPPGAPFPLAQYVGPALPPGRDFAGLAQIHGALDHPHTPLVLTDKDFAAAYMAHGWATRFLVDVFAGRAVLFVGYSVQDPLIRYLLRAIPPTGRWFALWSEEEVARHPDYTELPIRAITFRRDASGELFGDLNAGISHWSWYCTAPQLDHALRTEELIEDGPPASPRDEDYLRERLKTDAGRQAFWRTAKDPAWLRWAASNGCLDGLTDPASTDVTVTSWAWWCVDHFLNSEAPPLLKWLRSRPFSLHPAFTSVLCWYLWRAEPWPPVPVVRQLLALLLSQAPAWGREGYDWEWMLGRLVKEGCIAEAIAVLRFATQLRLEPLEEAYHQLRAMYSESDEPEPEPPRVPLATHVTTLVDPRRLEQFLDESGVKLAAAAPAEVLALAEARIAEAYDLLDLAGGEDGLDWLSLSRTAIATPLRVLSRGEDVLIELARLAVDALANAAPEQLDAFAERADHSSRTLFRRFAVYASARQGDAPADALLDRAAAREWPRVPVLQREMFLFLDAHYGRTSEPARARFISAVTQTDTRGDVSEAYQRRLRYNLAQKLHAVAPTSDVTAIFASAERVANPEWEPYDPNDEPTLSDDMEEIVDGSALDVAEVVGWDPAEVVARLRPALGGANVLDYVPSGFDVLRRAAASALPWATNVFAETAETAERDTAALRVATTVLWGIRDAEPAAVEDKIEFLRAAADGAWAQELIDPIATVIDTWSAVLKHEDPATLLYALDAAADTVYARVNGERPSGPEHTWTAGARTHPSGKAALVWLRVADARDWHDGVFAVSLDDAERHRWEQVIADDSAAGDWARPVLGMGIDRFSAGDLPWAVKTVFPVFDVASDPRRAAQVWDGRLSAHQWSWATLEALGPYLKGLFGSTETLLPHREKQLGDWVALLVTGRSGLSRELLEGFIEHATEDARVAFARTLPRHLARLQPSARQQLWSGLLKLYWLDRRTNMPCALSAGEIGEMIRWAEALPEVAGDVVAQLRASPVQKIEHAGGIIRNWKQNDSWTRAHPQEAADVILLLAEGESISHHTADDAARVLTSCFDYGASQATVGAAAELLVGLGSNVARILAERLRRGRDGAPPTLKGDDEP